MIFKVALGLLALALLLMMLPTRRLFPRREWRFGAGMLALTAFVVAALMGVRGGVVGWIAMAALIVGGMGLLLPTRRVGGKRDAPSPREQVSDEEARRILGVGPDASREEILAAYKRLMRVAHPDQGGTAGLAAQINAARDRLLGRK